MKTVFLWLAVGLVVLVPFAVEANEVTITDWRGASVNVTEGSVDSDGVKIVYHTVGEGRWSFLSIVLAARGSIFGIRW